MKKQKSKKRTIQRDGYINHVWCTSQNSQEFKQSLEKAGYSLAQGDLAKYVIVDKLYSEVENLNKHLPKNITQDELDNKLATCHEQLPNSYEALGYPPEQAKEKQIKYIEWVSTLSKAQLEQKAWLEKRQAFDRDQQAALPSRKKQVNQQIERIKKKNQERDGQERD